MTFGLLFCLHAVVFTFEIFILIVVQSSNCLDLTVLLNVKKNVHVFIMHFKALSPSLIITPTFLISFSTKKIADKCAGQSDVRQDRRHCPTGQRRTTGSIAV